MRRWIALQCARVIEALRPKLDQRTTIRVLTAELAASQVSQNQARSDYMERFAELQEARQMCGGGPWTIGPETAERTDTLLKAAAESFATGIPLRETIPLGAQGATADISLALENLEWRREGALSWLEFSRYGIQTIILICRLYYIKNPLIRRGINVSASYVMGRGFEVSSDNQAADDTLKAFFENNKAVLGQIAMGELHKRKFYDGNLFFVFFTDTQNTGDVRIRTIDATEIMEVISNPEDSDEPWFYRRKWNQNNVDLKTGAVSTDTREAYYPALNYSPVARQPQINGKEILWDMPILHRKSGAVSKWQFGCPIAFPAIDWAKASRKLLEDCATVRRSLAQVAWEISTKGGQQAIQGIKAQMSTTVGPPTSGWDTNPSAVTGSTFVAGSGTKMQAMKTAGAGGNPEDVRRYIHWVAMVFGVPETFFADASVGTVATAQSLDRPTELNFLQQQEEWREDLITIALYVLNSSKQAASGQLREKLKRADNVSIVECKRIMLSNGVRVYEKSKPNSKTIKIQVNFPAIREGDLPANVKAIVEAMTLDNKGGQIVGIDEKVGVGMLYSEFGIDNYQDILDEQYPAKYDPDRTIDPLPAPIGKIEPDPGGVPQLPGGHDPKPTDKQVAAAEKRISKNRQNVIVQRLIEAIQKLKSVR